MPAYTKRIIRQACIKVMDDPKSSPRDVVKAAAILERMGREKYLASRRKLKKLAMVSSKRPSGTLEQLLERAS